jgi:hypothetical protein
MRNPKISQITQKEVRSRKQGAGVSKPTAFSYDAGAFLLIAEG